ncbi:hypothetical protein [Christiangramia sediminis]|uniref:Histone deacetylase n=1 Tax=Christiangramia sediminis TaxID=2881336 RepID=A0A9X1LKL6_9FLAO|nr:hypothetical protein [Christiangramia sediminis]MCB7482025.1 hypothetical protein [Christiangramia sediminis]
MEEEITEVWYACYGSNIREERFLCYINGGTPPGALRNFTGCSDKSKPKQSRTITIDHEMYFAKKSPTWNGGGICFLNPEKDITANTLGRTYLINASQFIDLVRQELKFEGSITIDFERLVKEGSYNCMTDGRYGLLLYLGEIEGNPVVTFTSEAYLEPEINKPDEQYLLTILRGLKEIYTIKEMELLEYFKSKKGVENQFPTNELSRIIKMA